MNEKGKNMYINHELDKSAAYLNVITRCGSPRGKRKVYFTCHPKDFEKYFKIVCDDIFKTHDCAIYYTKDMSAPIPKEYLDTDLGQMNLFVIPITKRLLTTKNRTMDFDFKYAIRENISIPILPIMMEPNLDNIYSRKEKFGNLHYYNRFSKDITGITYEEKLMKYLSFVLIGNTIINRIKKAFDAYIFLSYRKKDRNYANELMKLIHNNPKYRDIAIWYDEFLPAGEDFESNIKKELEGSKFFTLLVTPNIVNKENYVQSTEYPLAMKMGKEILPVELINTDKNLLKKLYLGIPECINAYNQVALDKGILEVFKSISFQITDKDPEHTYLIGLAYLYGIDVEKNFRYGMELIGNAAISGHLEAIEKLSNMFLFGENIIVDYKEGLKWRELLYKSCVNKYGEFSKETLIQLDMLAYTYGRIGEYKKSLQLYEKSYNLMKTNLGENNSDTLISLNNLAQAYGKIGYLAKSLELSEKVYKLWQVNKGETNYNTLISLSNIATIYHWMGNISKSLELTEKTYNLMKIELSKNNIDTIIVMNNLASLYNEIGNFEKGFKLNREAYLLSKKLFGLKNPTTITIINNQALIYSKQQNFKKALEIFKKVYKLRKEVLKEMHRDTIDALINIGFIYCELHNPKSALRVYNKAYKITAKSFGKKDFLMLRILDGFAVSYCNLKDFDKAIQIFIKECEIKIKVFGKESKETIKTFDIINQIYSIHKVFKDSMKVNKKIYKIRCDILGEENNETLTILNNIGVEYVKQNEFEKAIRIIKKTYKIRSKNLGKDNFETLVSLYNLSTIFYKMNNIDKAIKLCQKVYDLGFLKYNEKHQFIIDLLNTLSEMYLKKKDYNKVIELSNESFDLNYKLTGLKGTDIITPWTNVGIAYIGLKDYEKSLVIFIELYEYEKDILPEKNAYLLSTIKIINHIYDSEYDDSFIERVYINSKVYGIRCEIYGENSDYAQIAFMNLIKSLSNR